MHVITILYPTADDSTFDMDYYTSSHMPMFASAIGDNLVSWGAATSHGKDYHAVGWATVKDLGEFNAAMKQHGAKIMGDVSNYSSVAPILVTGDYVAGSS